MQCMACLVVSSSQWNSSLPDNSRRCQSVPFVTYRASGHSACAVDPSSSSTACPLMLPLYGSPPAREKAPVLDCSKQHMQMEAGMTEHRGPTSCICRLGHGWLSLALLCQLLFLFELCGWRVNWPELESALARQVTGKSPL